MTGAMRLVCDLSMGRHSCAACGLSCDACVCRNELDADIAVMSESELRTKAMQQRRYIDVLVETERQRRRRSSIPPPPPPLPDAGPVVHVLLYGYALCGLMSLPRDWPPGHTWVRVDEFERATCDGCKGEATARKG